MGDWGLVLAGGGAKGAYQMGVWKFLCQRGYDKMFHAFSGTSVGALNAALFAQGDPAKAERVWQNVTKEMILSPKEIKTAKQKLKALQKDLDAQKKPPKGGETVPASIPVRYLGTAAVSVAVPGLGVAEVAGKGIKALIHGFSDGRYSRSGLSQIIDDNLDFSRLRDPSTPCYVTCCAVPALQRHYIDLAGPDFSDQLKRSYLLASSAYPGAFPAESVDGCTYYDGGIPLVGDNVPLRPLYEQRSIHNFLVVHLDPKGHLNANDFPDIRLVQLSPSKSLGGTFKFGPDRIKRNIDLGFEDMEAALPRIL